MSNYTIKANFIDIFHRETFPAAITVTDGIISSVEKVSGPVEDYILPGFVDAHIHIESSMLVPTEFARLAVVHGTVATVSDPHEIANVCGIEGVRYMIANSKQTPLKICFGAPSCVPATFFETAGAVIDSTAIRELLSDPDIWYLAEMMNYPGVLFGDPEVMAKLKAAREAGKPIDGHAPGLRGDQVKTYAGAGITTDHESFSYEEAVDKLHSGIKCLIREGSAARNFDALIPVLREFPGQVMFCSDDKHPDELLLHHINNHVKRALGLGYDLYDTLYAASAAPVLHYQLPVGLLRVGDPADFIITDHPDQMNIKRTYINGELVASDGRPLLPSIHVDPINQFDTHPIAPEILRVKATAGSEKLRVIEAVEGQLITNELLLEGRNMDGYWVSDVERDILKIVVLNRYKPDVPPAIAFIRNFALSKGAIASTVAHDCHNIIAVGVDDESIAAAINELVRVQGGVAVAFNAQEVTSLPLPVAGLMSADDGYKVAAAYIEIDQKARALGTPLKAPFMTLSFMALLVIPALKLSDKGLFSGASFSFTSLEEVNATAVI